MTYRVQYCGLDGRDKLEGPFATRDAAGQAALGCSYTDEASVVDDAGLVYEVWRAGKLTDVATRGREPKKMVEARGFRAGW